MFLVFTVTGRLLTKIAVDTVKMQCYKDHTSDIACDVQHREENSEYERQR